MGRGRGREIWKWDLGIRVCVKMGGRQVHSRNLHCLGLLGVLEYTSTLLTMGGKLEFRIRKLYLYIFNKVNK